MIDVLYFAWVRERIGLPREKVETGATTVADLIDELRGREDRYAAAFADISALRVALDQDCPRSMPRLRASAKWPSSPR